MVCFRTAWGYARICFEMFRKMIMGNADCYLPEIDTIRFTRPEEYALFKTQDVKSFLAVPYSRRENGIIL